MEKVDQYRDIIAAVIKRPASSKTINQPQLEKQLLVDQEKQNFLLFNTGWDNNSYIHDLLFHIELKDTGDIWILENNTDYPLEEKLFQAGVDENNLHIAWNKEKMTIITEYTAQLDYSLILKEVVERMASSTSLNAPDLKKQVIHDDQNNAFALVAFGWHNDNYVYDLLFRAEVRSHQIWVMQNNTDYPVEEVLVKARVAEKDIVLAWQQIAFLEEGKALVR
ncbi:MAG: element excision factor XisI family protein [Bacteroidota bacterium]